jgi:hypothetical protein
MLRNVVTVQCSCDGLRRPHGAQRGQCEAVKESVQKCGRLKDSRPYVQDRSTL